MRARSERSNVSGQVTSSHVPLGFIFSRLIISSGSNGPAVAADKTRQNPSAMARAAEAILFFMMRPLFHDILRLRKLPFVRMHVALVLRMFAWPSGEPPDLFRRCRPPCASGTE